ncbi:hypothetical protein ABZ568_00735 [Streptomyces olindensis]|uniref:Uncharacterized protein n=1 Tax=Streptomyces olindensis TaxID=358823 RepID=A0ABV2XLW2_9ACTN
MALTDQRWRIRYSYSCNYTDNGRQRNTTFLNNGVEKLTPEEAVAVVAKTYRHEGPFADIEIWQETPEERDQRLAARAREEANEANGIWWGMGGAN